jgi:hypothetical protein
MKQFKLSSKRKSSGQVVVLLIIVLALLGGAWWWLNSNKENAARRNSFAKEATQKIAVQHDINFFNSRLSPQARMNFPASTQQEFMNEIVKLGAPFGRWTFRARLNLIHNSSSHTGLSIADILSSEIRRYGPHHLAPGRPLAD